MMHVRMCRGQPSTRYEMRFDDIGITDCPVIDIIIRL